MLTSSPYIIFTGYKKSHNNNQVTDIYYIFILKPNYIVKHL